MSSRPLVVGLSGASAPIYGIRLLELLSAVPEVETHLVYTRTVPRTVELETGYGLDKVRNLADVVHEPDDMAAAISSGSFKTRGMIVAPCSIHTVSCLANSITKDLLTRAADVTLKERRPLVLLVRESPLHLGHLRRLVEVAELGGIVAPPIPSFYHHPDSLQDLVDHSLGRALDVFDISVQGMKRWSTPPSPLAHRGE